VDAATTRRRRVEGCFPFIAVGRAPVLITASFRFLDAVIGALNLWLDGISSYGNLPSIRIRP